MSRGGRGEPEPASEPIVLGDRHSWHGHRIRSFLDRNIVEYRWVDADCDEGERLRAGISDEGRSRLPVVFFADGSWAAQPSNVLIARGVGIATRPSSERYELVIVGAGPAGLAAGVYGASEGLSTAIIEREAPGGQAGQSSKIENYLGFPKGLSGAELTKRATIQARRFGTEIVQPTRAVSLAVQGQERCVQLSDHSVLRARSLLIATGVEYRRLRAPGVAELIGAGVSYGAAPRDAEHAAGQRVFIVGGANSAGQAAVHFAAHARSVTMLVRGESLRKSMSQYLIDQIEGLDNVEVQTGTEVVEAHGEGCLEAISVAWDGERLPEPVPAEALLVFIGAAPHTEWLEGAVARGGRGFILAGRNLAAGGGAHEWPLDRDPHALETSAPGVFVAGDVRQGSVKRVASAVGEGSMAVQLVHQYLREGEGVEGAGRAPVPGAGERR